MAKKIENHFGYWPVTTPLESCFWAWSKLEPESTSATPYLNAKGLGGPVKGSFFTGTVVALSGLKTGLESARTKGNKMTRQALKNKMYANFVKVFFQRLFLPSTWFKQSLKSTDLCMCNKILHRETNSRGQPRTLGTSPVLLHFSLGKISQESQLIKRMKKEFSMTTFVANLLRKKCCNSNIINR